MLGYKANTSDSRPENLKNLAIKFLGIDRAIGFTILARGWGVLAGLVTMFLVAQRLSVSEQGYYYTFSSLIALQVVFELGFSFVILQLAAHERAHLQFKEGSLITGDEVALSRLASVFQKAVRWYACGAILMALLLMPAGMHFFSVHKQSGAPVSWLMPWICVVLAAVGTFQIDPIFSLLEGCGKIYQVARLRLAQALLGSLMAWFSLYIHHGLFAPAAMIGSQVIVGSMFLYRQRSILRQMMCHSTKLEQVSWRREIWPFQWRIAVSWLCGYFIFQLFNPVLFAFHGAKEAGKMGMSLSISSALSAVAVSWMSTKASPFGVLVAKKDFRKLDTIFFKTLLQSTVVLFGAALSFFVVLEWMNVNHIGLAERIIPPHLFSLLLLTIISNHIVFSMAIYLRAHKKEPYLVLSLSSGLLTACSTFFLGKYFGVSGVTTGYFIINGLGGLVLGTAIFVVKRKEWHADINGEGNTVL